MIEGNEQNLQDNLEMIFDYFFAWILAFICSLIVINLGPGVLKFSNTENKITTGKFLHKLGSM